jgi:hypothetical protein
LSTSLLIRIVVSTSLLHRRSIRYNQRQPLLPSHENKKFTAISSSLALSFFLFIGSRSLEHFSQFFVDKIQDKIKEYILLSNTQQFTNPTKLFQGREHFQNSQPSSLTVSNSYIITLFPTY